MPASGKDCQHCGKRILYSDKFCIYCGQKNACCSICDTPLDAAKDKFCSLCGAPYPMTEEYRAQYKPLVRHELNKHWLKSGWMVPVLILITGLAIPFHLPGWLFAAFCWKMWWDYSRRTPEVAADGSIFPNPRTPPED